MGAEINSSFLSASMLIFSFYIEYVVGSTSTEGDSKEKVEWDYESDLPWWAILLIVGGVLGLFLVLCLVYNKCDACKGH